MQNMKLGAKYRADMSKSRTKEIRREGYVTGSVFGHDTEPVSIEVSLAELASEIRQTEMGVKSLIDLKIDGAPTKADGTVIIKNIYKDPLTRRVLDIQFQRISMMEKIHVGVPIVLIGDAPGVKDGGTVEQSLDELPVNCLPGNIPAQVEVDVTGLDVGHLIRVKDLPAIPGDVEVLADAETVVVNCRPPHVAKATEAEEEAAAAAAEASTPAEGEAEA